jgi:8-oxo-dGTP pyrophosphatase MutT (NUDIX family)
MNESLHITVAAVVEHEGRFLLLEERIEGTLKLNQPAGHLEPGENLCQAVVRETREETARAFHPDALVGLYLWRAPASDVTFLRAAFCGTVGDPESGRRLDTGIERTLWLSRDEIRSRETQWRSPLVLRCIDDYLAGRRFPIDILVDMLPHA